MSEKNEKPTKKNVILPPPSPEMNQEEVNQVETTAEQDLDLLKEAPDSGPIPPDDLFLEEVNTQKGIEADDLNNPADVTENVEEFVFTKPVKDSERKHYENILSANRETISKLRKENMELHSLVETLKKE